MNKLTTPPSVLLKRDQASGAKMLKDGIASAVDTAIANGNLAQLHSLQSAGIDLTTGSADAILRAIKGGHWEALHFWFQAGGQVPNALLAEDILLHPIEHAQESSIFEARQHLLTTSSHFSKRSIPPTGPRWESYSLWTRIVIRHLNTSQDVIRFAQDPYGHGGFESRFGRKATEEYAAEQEAHLSERFPQFKDALTSFDESSLSDPETTAIVKGRSVSGPLYANVTFFLEIHSRMDAPQSVCEIGGGYGGPSRLWLTNSVNNPKRYVIIDLPESLFFSEVFLKREFGNEKIFYVESTQEIDPKTLDDALVILCPIQFFEALRSVEFDLVFNTLSMQEMSDDYVEFYSAWLDRQPVRHFYSFNYAGQPAGEHPESANWGVPRLSHRWEPVWVGEYAAGPSPAVHVLARKKHEIEDVARQGQAILKQCKSEKLGPSVIVNLLFAARMINDAAVTCSIIRHIISSSDILPREVMLLLRWLPTQKGYDGIDAIDRGMVSNALALMVERGEAQAKSAPYLEVIRSTLV